MKSGGLGHHLLKVAARVQIPLGVPLKKGLTPQSEASGVA